DRFLDALADSFDPLLAIIALAVPLIRTPRRFRPGVAYYLSAAAAIGFVYLVRAIDDRYHLWSAAGFDFSTHSAFAASLAVSIATFQRRWAGPLALAVLLYFSLELVMRYHGLLDILTSASLAALTAFLLHTASIRVTRSGADSQRNA